MPHEFLNCIQITGSGNCNFAYVTGVRTYGYTEIGLHTALQHLFTGVHPSYSWSSVPPKDSKPAWRGINCGAYIFAQGSEDNIVVNPYAPNLAELIIKLGLGEITKVGPIPNSLHMMKPGYMFIWVIDHKACLAWWQANVLAPWELLNKDSIVRKTK